MSRCCTGAAARAMVVGIEFVPAKLNSGASVLVDGEEGIVVWRPGPDPSSASVQDRRRWLRIEVEDSISEAPRRDGGTHDDQRDDQSASPERVVGIGRFRDLRRDGLVRTSLLFHWRTAAERGSASTGYRRDLEWAGGGGIVPHARGRRRQRSRDHRGRRGPIRSRSARPSSLIEATRALRHEASRLSRARSREGQLKILLPTGEVPAEHEAARGHVEL